MHDLYNLKEMLCKELSDYGKDGGLSLSSLETIDKLAHAAKNVAKLIEESEEYSRDGGSYRSYDGGSYYGNSRYSRDGYYYDGGGMSGRRGRAANGRFVSRDGSEMARRLREMMEDAPDESVKREIGRLAEKMESM